MACSERNCCNRRTAPSSFPRGAHQTCLRSTESAVRHAPIDRLITRFKVALLIARTRPRLVGGHAGPNPGDLFYASLLVLGNNDFIAPRADLGGWSSHKLTHIDD